MLIDETSTHNEFEWTRKCEWRRSPEKTQAIPQTVGGQTNMFSFECLFSCNWYLHEKIIAKNPDKSIQ